MLLVNREKYTALTKLRKAGVSYITLYFFGGNGEFDYNIENNIISLEMDYYLDKYLPIIKKFFYEIINEEKEDGRINFNSEGCKGYIYIDLEKKNTTIFAETLQWEEEINKEYKIFSEDSQEVDTDKDVEFVESEVYDALESLKEDGFEEIVLYFHNKGKFSYDHDDCCKLFPRCRKLPDEFYIARSYLYSLLEEMKRSGRIYLNYEEGCEAEITIKLQEMELHIYAEGKTWTTTIDDEEHEIVPNFPELEVLKIDMEPLDLGEDDEYDDEDDEYNDEDDEYDDEDKGEE